MSEEIGRVKSWKIFLPVLIGLLSVAYLFIKEFDPSAFDEIDFTWLSVFWLLMAVVCIVGRDFGYIVRIKALSENQLTWRQSFRVIMLWEFTSAVTPSSIGGTSVALMYVHKEGIGIGKSSAMVMMTSLLDEMYFVLMFPVLLLAAGASRLFDIDDSPGWTHGMFWLAMTGYILKLAWVAALAYGMFVNPKGLGKLIFTIFKLPFLKRWKRGAVKALREIELSSTELKSRKKSFWITAFLTTFVSWTSRYCIVNCLFLAFFAVDDHFLIFARQLVMWIAMLLSPTPGGSGIAEIMFGVYLGEFIPLAGFAVAVALLWRLVTYYPYLIVGALMVPKWISDKFIGKQNRGTKNRFFGVRRQSENPKKNQVVGDSHKDSN
ncbi:MAG: flippase-like domain-containing protein [Prevotellaceae bacterium]|jgi:uncharacterized protein (TIRG00374 family)|nr:flippase-like domain-containing protein [Prevotellaceae bacterium]